METPRHSVSVAAAVLGDDGRVLCVQRRDNGHWEPPGGVLELGEGIHAGLIREVREETGLSVEIETLTGVYKNLRQGVVALVFRCRVVGGELQVTDETLGAAWLDRAEVEARMDEAYAVRVFDSLDYRGGPAIRSHDGRALLTDPNGREAS